MQITATAVYAVFKTRHRDIGFPSNASGFTNDG
jgi:hypothetical protein